MWEQFQRYSALSPLARGLFRRSIFLLPIIRASLSARGYKKTQAWLQRRLSSPSRLLPPDASAQRGDIVPPTCRMVNAASHYGFIRPTCLESSLALWYLLREQGIVPSLRIGVRKSNGKFEAHAWIEYQGETLNQPDQLHRHYAAFDNEFSEPPASSQ